MTAGLVLPRLGMGCMRLSTAADRDDDRAVAVIHAALDAGVRLLDTADAYARDDSEIGHNERLIARALASWPGGDRRDVVIATKGGMTRPHGLWITDGRARHLAAACAASRAALGVDRIALYQLHAPDPRTPLATSVRALDALRRDGLVAAIGLCNVTVAQIEEACAIAPIASVQVELGVWCDRAVLGGVVDFCLAHGIAVLAHRPLGGEQRQARTARDRVLRDLAARHGATPAEIALAALLDRWDRVTPLPGPTRVETASSIGRAASIVLDGVDRDRLADRFPAWQSPGATPLATPPAGDAPAVAPSGDVVLIMGLAGAGKSTLAARFAADGYHRLNRDEAGGALRQLVPALERARAGGAARIVLDNTYLSRASRAPVIASARRLGLAVRCLHLATPIEDAQINVAARLLERCGRLLGGDELREAGRRDPGVFAPGAQFRMQRALEPPALAEGFAAVETVPFVRRWPPDCTGRAVIAWCDGIAMRSRSGARTPVSPDDLDLDAADESARVLRRHATDGWRIVGLSWQPAIAAGTRSTADVEATLAAVRARLAVDIDLLYCPHGDGPPACWCRKPLPGLAVLAILRHRLDPARCLYVGDGPQDPGFARRFGFAYRPAPAFFAAGAGS